MIHPLYIRDSLVNRITYYHLLAFLTALPFDRFYSQLVLVSLVLHTVINMRKTAWKQVDWKTVLLLQSVFFITVICTAWSVYATIGIGAWEKQAAIFLFPLLLFLHRSILQKHGEKLLTGFAFVITLTIVYLYTDAFRIMAYYNFPLEKLFSVFFLNHNFAKPIGLHATYLSLYTAVAILVIFHNLLIMQTKKTGKIVQMFCLFILSAGLLQLASRSVLIAFLLIINCVLPFYFAKGKMRFRFLAFTLFVSAIVIFCMVRLDGFHFRLVQGLKDDLATTSLSYSLVDPRATRWELAFDLVKESPVIGYGTGSEIPLLKQAYFENRLYDSYLNELNAHNQYLSFLLKGGLMALFAYLLTLYWAFRRALRSRDLLFVAFLLLLAITGVSENLLDVNKGIFFYAFFLSFFALRKQKDAPDATGQQTAGNSERNPNVFIYKKEVTV